MALERCASGHFYDPAKHTTCPYCGVPDLQMERTQPKRDVAVAEAVAPPAVSKPAVRQAEGVTQPLGRQKSGADPVVGWLVCISGPDRGLDFRIHAERNFIGRSEGNDIRIAGDASISREKHAEICFDPRNVRFDIVAGSGRSIVYVNGQPVHTTSQLKAKDTIDIGQTRLMFVPLCDDNFRWEAGA